MNLVFYLSILIVLMLSGCTEEATRSIEDFDFNWMFAKEDIAVQVYTNCEEAELFLNGNSLDKKQLANLSEEDNIIKWLGNEC